MPSTCAAHRLRSETAPPEHCPLSPARGCFSGCVSGGGPTAVPCLPSSGPPASQGAELQSHLWNAEDYGLPGSSAEFRLWATSHGPQAQRAASLLQPIWSQAPLNPAFGWRWKSVSCSCGQDKRPANCSTRSKPNLNCGFGLWVGALILSPQLSQVSHGRARCYYQGNWWRDGGKAVGALCPFVL